MRRVLLDLKEDFGFKVDSWNQAYQYDILPITITEEEMKPGDLVFISGTYFNKKCKQNTYLICYKCLYYLALYIGFVELFDL